MVRPEIIAASFAGGEAILSCAGYGNGHINDTYRVETGRNVFILQKINRHVFVHPDEVMENLAGVTEHISRRMAAEGTNPERRVLQVVRTDAGKSFLVDEEGETWRATRFVEGGVCYERPETEDLFRESAVAFGNFQRLLSDYPAGTLYETIPGFHDTPHRLLQFKQALSKDRAGRAKGVSKEISFLLEREELAGCLAAAAGRGDLPLRVTHNDTKLNNVLMDEKTGKWLCVLDLDTVMPGFAVTDFGDAIRFGASTAAEDETDLCKVHFDRHLYEVYKDGYLEGLCGALTSAEIRLLPEGAKVITYEQALRFLGDYLAGDVYYKTARPEHNLDRARTQMRLLEEMEEKL